MIEYGEWILTDEDTFEHVLQRTDDVFSLMLIYPLYECRHENFSAHCRSGCCECEVYRGTICLADYDEEEINEYIKWYDYKFIDEIKETYGDSWRQIVAECIFELDVSDCFYERRFSGSYEQCKEYIKERMIHA